ncbi:hypothetical protein AVEN_50054-1 [Araneus ventricosus]|uniref:Uncharacterized protein n=1 Tax=Araneus ventricosus TaxID=182803 RepID=A0A4Y2GAE4_ARAVE|nr:hypothetical protein AVEN_50054-1 [Araneus ventricosus]
MEKTADTHPTSCNFLEFNKMSKVKKILDDAREQNNPEIDLVDKGITSFEEMPALSNWVVVKYDESFYAGEVTQVLGNDIEASAMENFGNGLNEKIKCSTT